MYTWCTGGVGVILLAHFIADPNRRSLHFAFRPILPSDQHEPCMGRGYVSCAQ